MNVSENISNLPLPPNLRQFFSEPSSPWNMSSQLFERVRNSAPYEGNPFRACKVLQSDPEYAFIRTYFNYSKPPGFGIKNILCVHNPTYTESFVGSVKNNENEGNNPVFAPKWHVENQTMQREAVIQRWKQMTDQFPNIKVTSGNRVDSITKARVLPLWHGVKEQAVVSICEAGFTYFGKHKKDGSSTDPGYFGSGIYFTNSAAYAKMYSQGRLILAWVTTRDPFPVINDVPHPAKGSDMNMLFSNHKYKNYNAHFIPVASIRPNDPTCMEYYPCYKNQKPSWDELVVFDKAQTVCRFVIELTTDLPHPVSNVPAAAQAFHALNLNESNEAENISEEDVSSDGSEKSPSNQDLDRFLDPEDRPTTKRTVAVARTKKTVEEDIDTEDFYRIGESYFKTYSSKAVQYFEKASAKGHLEATAKLADMYAHKLWGVNDPKKSFHYTLLAASSGHVNCQLNLGKFYSEGKGVQQNDEKAVYWFKKAARAGHQEAALILLTKYHIK